MSLIFYGYYLLSNKIGQCYLITDTAMWQFLLLALTVLQLTTQVEAWLLKYYEYDAMSSRNSKRLKQAGWYKTSNIEKLLKYV